MVTEAEDLDILKERLKPLLRRKIRFYFLNCKKEGRVH